MQLSDALDAKRKVFAAMGLSYVPTRSEEPRCSVGVSVANASRDGFRIAVRARSADDLQRAQARSDFRGLAVPHSELDVRITGPITAPPAVPAGTPTKRQLHIGASIGHFLCTAGTLGFFGRRLADGAIGIVSNNHVLASGDQGQDGDDVLHPGPADHAIRELDVVGYLAGDYPRLDLDNPVVDCAFATLRPGIEYDAARIGTNGGRLRADAAPVELQRDVIKCGRTTGVTRGRISAFAMDHCDVEYDFGIVIFDRQIEIESTESIPFSKPGDSGSLVVTHDGHAIGLLAAASIDCRLHYANPIGEVLGALGVTLLV